MINQLSEQNAGSEYTFASEPRAVKSFTRKKFRNPNGSTSGSAGSMMLDPRVMPWQQEPKGHNKMSQSVYDLQPPEKTFIPVDLAPYLVEQVEKPESSDVTTQTDKFNARPITPPYIPRKTGIDVSTQIDESDIDLGCVFNFDLEVEPILQIIMGKTIEQAQMEVEEEEELKAITYRREELDAINAAERARIRAMEEQEQEVWRLKQLKLKAERERLRRETVVTEKVSSVQFSLELLSGMDEHVADWMDSKGYLQEGSMEAVEMEFMPWVMKQVEQKLENARSTALVVDGLVASSLRRGYKLFDERRCWIRVMVKGAPESPPEPVGPIPVYPSESVGTVLRNIQAWMDKKREAKEKKGKKKKKKNANRFRSKKDQPQFTLLYNGVELEPAVLLLKIAKDLRLLEVRTPEYQDAIEKDSDDEDDDEDEGGGRRRR